MISEYVSCHIFESMGFDVQKTLLGTYDITSDNRKLAVACKDFTVGGYVLKEFVELKNSIINTSNNGYGTDLDEVLDTMEEQTLIDTTELKRYFWDMFIGDALLGNFDRHNGNWGFLINISTGERKLAPIFDCGSCLYPQLDDESMKDYLSDRAELEKRVFVFPNSALRDENGKINYHTFIDNLQNEECNEALLRVFPRIDLSKIDEFIDETPYISDVRKTFYKKIIQMRYEMILSSAYQKLVARKDNI